MLIEHIIVDERFADMLPEPENYQALKEDIEERGVLVPLMLTEDNLLLDGHTRLGIATEVGIEEVPTFHVPVPGHNGSWRRAFAVAVNLNRRHLNVAQRAALASSLERIERTRAKQRQGTRNDLHAPTDQLLGHSSPEVVSRPNRASARVAKKAGISRKTYEKAQKVLKEGDDDTRKRMLAGNLSVAALYGVWGQRGRIPVGLRRLWGVELLPCQRWALGVLRPADNLTGLRYGATVTDARSRSRTGDTKVKLPTPARPGQHLPDHESGDHLDCSGVREARSVVFCGVCSSTGGPLSRGLGGGSEPDPAGL